MQFGQERSMLKLQKKKMIVGKMVRIVKRIKTILKEAMYFAGV